MIYEFHSILILKKKVIALKNQFPGNNLSSWKNKEKKLCGNNYKKIKIKIKIPRLHSYNKINLEFFYFGNLNPILLICFQSKLFIYFCSVNLI